MKDRRCVTLTIKQKIEIIRYMEVHKNATDNVIAEIFSTEYKKKISRRAINDIRNNKAKILEMNNEGKGNIMRTKNLKFELIDEKISSWIEKIESFGGIINDNLIKQKALAFANEAGIEDFKASTGWLGGMKKRHGLKLRTLPGESHGIKIEDAKDFLCKIKELVYEYGQENIFNADETGIFYKLIPSKTICRKTRNGFKLLKDRFSVLFCVNMAGDQKIKPLVIGKFANPRCFKGMNLNNYIDYKYSSRSWMTSQIFNS